MKGCLRRSALALVLAMLAPLLPAPALAAPASLDANWASSGTYTATGRRINALAVDGGGHVLLAGEEVTGAYLRRLGASGQVDSTFAAGGTRELTADVSLRPRAIVPLTDGSAYVALQKSTDMNSLANLRIRHVLADGSMDASFAGSGVLQIDNAVVQDLFVDAGGRLYVVAASVLWDPDQHWSVSRFLADGSPDASYASGGSYTGPGWASTAALLPGEQLVVFHQVQTITAGGTTTTWYRQLLSPDGAPVSDTVHSVMAGFEVTDTAAVPGASAPGETNIAVNRAAPGASSSLSPLALAYPDGLFYLFGDTLSVWKYLVAGNDLGWNNGSNESNDYVINGSGDAAGAVDARGRILMAVNTLTGSPGGAVTARPGVILRLQGKQPDVTPAEMATAPSLIIDGGNYRTSSPVVVAGLGSSDWTPARLSRGELSADGGSTWLRGWAWVHNGSTVLVRYPLTDPAHPGGPSTATLSIGGVISPNHPALALGNPLEIHFADAAATVANPAPEPAEAVPPPPGGGALDAMLLGLLALLTWRRQARR